jgi:hypothetical protein
MAAQFLTRLLESLCPHRFSWPHSGAHGEDYQVCLICGAAFGYDWSTMRRTGPLALPAANRGAGLASGSDGPITAKARTIPG